MEKVLTKEQIYRAAHYVANRERELAYQKARYIANRAEIQARQKVYRAARREEIRAHKKGYEAAHRVEIRARKKAHRAAHLEEEREAVRKYLSARRKKDIAFRVLGNLRTRIVKVLKGKNKSAATEALIGCSIPDFLLHLESQFRPGMTWENYGPVWHIDHIKPCARFDLSNPAQQRECFHFSNQQPLFAEENLKKGAK